jgi:hypothetical protein
MSVLRILMQYYLILAFVRFFKIKEKDMQDGMLNMYIEAWNVCSIDYWFIYDLNLKIAQFCYMLLTIIV